MVVDNKRNLRPEYRRRCGLSGDSRELSSSVGVDVESMSPRSQAVTGLVVGGTILLGAALLGSV
jgi:hypothetical protein